MMATENFGYIMNYKAHLDEMRRSRDAWLENLNANPDSLTAAQYIVTINAQIRYIDSLRRMAGDYDE
jgi:hypothetical protein